MKTWKMKVHFLVPGSKHKLRTRHSRNTQLNWNVPAFRCMSDINSSRVCTTHRQLWHLGQGENVQLILYKDSNTHFFIRSSYDHCLPLSLTNQLTDSILFSRLDLISTSLCYFFCSLDVATNLSVSNCVWCFGNLYWWTRARTRARSSQFWPIFSCFNIVIFSTLFIYSTWLCSLKECSTCRSSCTPRAPCGRFASTAGPCLCPAKVFTLRVRPDDVNIG